jgi:hypothetical protein
VLELTSKMVREALESNRFKVMRTVTEGVDHVTRLVREAEQKADRVERHHYDFEINDYPEYARQRVCTGQYLASIGLLTNTVIKLRGCYVEPARKKRATERPLFLHIDGENRYQVESAYRELKAQIEQVALASGGTRLNGKYALR